MSSTASTLSSPLPNHDWGMSQPPDAHKHGGLWHSFLLQSPFHIIYLATSRSGDPRWKQYVSDFFVSYYNCHVTGYMTLQRHQLDPLTTFTVIPLAPSSSTGHLLKVCDIICPVRLRGCWVTNDLVTWHECKHIHTHTEIEFPVLSSHVMWLQAGPPFSDLFESVVL